MTTTKFKKVRLFKLVRELNVSLETLKEHLEENGYADALTGSGINAAIQDEAAYNELLSAFADDMETAARVHKKRARQTASEEPPAGPEPEVVEPAEEPQEIVAAGDGAAAPVAEVEPLLAESAKVEQEKAPKEDVVAEGVVAPEAVVEPDEDSAEAVAEEAPVEAEAAPAPLSQETAAAEPPVAEEELETTKETAAEASGEEVSVEEAPVEEVAAEGEALEFLPEGTEEPAADIAPFDEEESEEEGAETLSAKRYQLAGTTVLGKMDLSEVEEEAPAKRKRKRKRKRKAPIPGEDEETIVQEGEGRQPAKRKRRRKGAVTDEEDIEETLQKTLREIEQGTGGGARRQRRRRRRERHAEQREQEIEEQREQEKILRVPEFVSTGDLAGLMNIAVNEVIQKLFESGMIVSINQRLDADTISFVADEYEYDVEFITEFGTEDIILEEDDPALLKIRAPIVTVMGHVDHGKTSLLDYIRSANVVAGEAGGITQHIGAHKVNLPDGRDITFLDTPGHEAFTAMRARGAKVTDVVVLVVAADDSVMPQTLEAINHARAAEVPVVVAINKIDKEEANADKVMQQLADHNVLVEQYGGKVQCAPVSAHTGEGVSDLMEKILLESEVMELKANPDRNADGVVIESRLEKGRGNVATVLVRNGTLQVGDYFIAGLYNGRVRAMFDERDRRVEEAGPSQPALVLGLSGSPEAGDQLVGLDEEKEARDISQRRQQIHREQSLRQKKHITLDEIGRRLALGDFKELNMIIKADVGGSVEALEDSLLKLSTEEVALNVIHSGVGAITESDVMLASASDAVIIGFQVRPSPGARALAEREEIDIRTYSVIYDAIEDIRDALEGLLSPEEKEVTRGTVEVRELFKVPKAGTVAGCYVIEGKIRRNDRMRVIREGVVIYEGEIDSLKRFKDDVREVQSGYECGISIKGYNDIKVGDQVEGYEIIEEKRTLQVGSPV
ncbi:MAG: translation initiation factor IF-2 [Bacteroidetes bacterium SB0662_bin_6]|nr:translation initiation factor IF-2 [Bacteroidetes bacterium SB0668_bin_1]MYE04905.1 translation initiation factor IF-2 [Bacteroidetes bacterium SB0662_bin_6]